MGSLFLGFVGGLIACGVTFALGQPLFRLANLRGEAARVLAKYESDMGGRSSGWAEQRRTAYRTCGARLVAWAATNQYLANWLERALALSPRNAGTSLMALAEMSRGDPRWRDEYRSTTDSLRMPAFQLIENRSAPL
jgi:hypothetical protein